MARSCASAPSSGGKRKDKDWIGNIRPSLGWLLEWAVSPLETNEHRLLCPDGLGTSVLFYFTIRARRHIWISGQKSALVAYILRTTGR